MSDKKPNRVGIIIAVAASVLIFGFAGWLLLNRQYVIDQVSVWAYEVPADVQAIEDRIDLSGEGTFYFRASQPVVLEAADFNQNCPRQEVGNPILGCYAEGRIFVYDIKDDQLDGIEEVTAAHEMLHAVWERMNAGEQRRVGALLRAEYAKLADSELKTRMDYYARTEPGQFENELHSIIGTEMSGISSELERYYARYFDDRQKILDLHDKYDAVFKDLQNKADTLYKDLTSLATSLEIRSEAYDTDVKQLSADIAAFNARADSGDFDSIAQFNQERAQLVARTNQLEADRSAINQDIATYNQKYNQYQAIASQIEALNKSIDSFTNLEPVPSL